ncbi:pantoate--beta-alanine ligase [Coralloluteibacterium stylophorae]|uniref:Pantothenate synthetase n=1 Tax=Coralloluteibacterium stylophorae TaxID=1776034 RepID=A0A8J7VU40_9GAMM|nr:pantoate--beta-alanine ligase [Coralloluteibacterium stylophorae]MBS7458713.1 pantoate--beta-alanine ligase [Coralloluteibacterium stylophorae]
MFTVRTVSDLRAAVGGWKRAGERVAFVPTMGNLHAGHHSLVTLARRQADRVVASVFVNPTQFGPNEDFGRYPRTPDADAAGLADAGCDVMFLPGVEQMYPFGAERCVGVHVPGLTDVMDGAHRPGHFDGVATVVLRLFNMVQPDLAVFGRKDFQQFRVIEYLVRDLSLPVTLIAGETRREDDGLAMSSRNQYLSPEERARAPEIHRTLQFMREAARRQVPPAAIAAEAGKRLTAAGFVVDYAELRRAEDLAPAVAGDAGVVAFVAARLGSTRLIDNLAL